MGQGVTLQYSQGAFVFGRIGLAIRLVDGGLGGAVKPEGGHRETALFDQVREVGGYQGRRFRYS